MPNCTFCGINIEKGTGKLFVYTSGKTANFCSNKCEKNLLQLKRKPVRTKWTAEYRKEHKKGQSPLNFPAESKKDLPKEHKETKEVKDTKVEKETSTPKTEETSKVEEKKSEVKEEKTEESKNGEKQ